jgi:hypothetical protein
MGEVVQDDAMKSMRGASYCFGHLVLCALVCLGTMRRVECRTRTIRPGLPPPWTGAVNRLANKLQNIGFQVHCPNQDRRANGARDEMTFVLASSCSVSDYFPLNSAL